MTINLRKSEAKEPFSFIYVNAEGKTIVKSENYSQKPSAKNGIESVRKNCQDDARYEFKKSSNEKFFFNIKATNAQFVGTSALFVTEEERTAAIAELKVDSGDAKVSEV